MCLTKFIIDIITNKVLPYAVHAIILQSSASTVITKFDFFQTLRNLCAKMLSLRIQECVMTNESKMTAVLHAMGNGPGMKVKIKIMMNINYFITKYQQQ